MKFRFIRDHAGRFAVETMCRILNVSRSGYYAWRDRPESPRKQKTRHLKALIRIIFNEYRQTYGSPSVHDELVKRGERCSLNRTARLMREEGLRAKQARKFRVTTDSDHNLPVAPNLLQREFTALQPNTVWASDITYIHTQEGWLYLAVVIDLHSRRVVGWAMSNRITRHLVMDAFNMAWKQRNPRSGLIFHSDRGSQYASNDFRNLLKKTRCRQSMSRRGDCWDNAPVESFFKTLKTELVNHRPYKARSQAIGEIFEYMEAFYNRKRRHSTLGFLSPVAFEEQKKVA